MNIVVELLTSLSILTTDWGHYPKVAELFKLVIVRELLKFTLW